jgi:hypothetical protein
MKGTKTDKKNWNNSNPYSDLLIIATNQIQKCVLSMGWLHKCSKKLGVHESCMKENTMEYP